MRMRFIGCRNEFLLVGLACVLSLLMCHGGSVAADDAGPYRRWAIVATKPLEEAGFADLLTAELSEETGLALVERQELERILKEQELSAVFASQAAKERLQLGQLLKADVLLLLSLEEREKRKFLKLVVSDCRYGARLRLEYLPYEAERLESLSTECAAIVRETRQQFAAGIKHLIGVTHFLSKNLMHDYDHLQAGYAALLAHALAQFPGVAVLEIEEARAIARELSLTAGDLEKRAVPLFVEGEFQMSSSKPETEATVAFVVRVSDGKVKRTEIQKQDLTGESVTEFLTRELPLTIAKLTQDARIRPYGRAAQHEALVRRARAFSELGLYEQSTDLWEAALLLKFDDADSRLELLADYRIWQYRRFAVLHAELVSKVRREGDAAAMVAEFFGFFRLVRAHVEELLRRRAVTAAEADPLVFRTISDLGFTAQPGSPEIRDAAADFFWRTIPLLARLDSRIGQTPIRQAVQRYSLRGPVPENSIFGPSTWAGQRWEWRLPAVQCLIGDLAGCNRIRSRPDHTFTLEYLYRLLTEFPNSPEDAPWFAGIVLPKHREGLTGRAIMGELPVKGLRRFYERLAESDKPHLDFYARCGLLALRVHLGEGPPLDAEALKEAEGLLVVVDRWQSDRLRYPLLIRYLQELRSDLANQLEPATKKRHPLLAPAFPVPEPSPRVQFLRVEDIPTEWLGLKRCHESLDLIWSLHEVSVMRRTGDVQLVFGVDPAREIIHAVDWDGENIWVATSESGIRVVSLEGMVLGHLQREHGLPEYARVRIPPYLAHRLSRPVILHGVEPGKCLAIGTLGQDQRQWFALLSQKADQAGKFSYDVSVFHTATKADPIRADDADDDAHQAFNPTWILRYPERLDGNPDRLLVGREFRFGAKTLVRQPLAIDLKAPSVSVFPQLLPARNQFYDFPIAVGEHILFAKEFEIEAYIPDGREPAQWTRKSLFAIPFLERYERKLYPFVIVDGGFAYNPGAEWRRIDAETLEVDDLTQRLLPLQYHFDHYALSARYRLVAWNRGDRLYRVLVDQPVDPLTTEDQRWAFVPAPLRDKHRRAAEEIERLGGHVDAVWSWRSWDPTPGSISTEAPAWHSIVYLPKTWSGRDTGLSHLKGLDRLHVLFVVQAEITDAGLPAIADVEELEALHLLETKATDQGIGHLRRLKRLSHLRLEGTAGGGEFTDAALEPLAELPLLRWLGVYGPGFTDQGLTHLEAMKLLRALYHVDTAISQKGLLELKSRKPGLQTQEAPLPQLIRRRWLSGN